MTPDCRLLRTTGCSPAGGSIADRSVMASADAFWPIDCGVSFDRKKSCPTRPPAVLNPVFRTPLSSAVDDDHHYLRTRR
jgi:hypothetical protein